MERGDAVSDRVYKARSDGGGGAVARCPLGRHREPRRGAAIQHPSFPWIAAPRAFDPGVAITTNAKNPGPRDAVRGVCLELGIPARLWGGVLTGGRESGARGILDQLNSLRISCEFWLAIDSDWMPSCSWVCSA